MAGDLPVLTPREFNAARPCEAATRGIGGEDRQSCSGAEDRDVATTSPRRGAGGRRDGSLLRGSTSGSAHGGNPVHDTVVPRNRCTGPMASKRSPRILPTSPPRTAPL